MKKTAFLSLSFLLLTACGGGDGGAANQAVVVTKDNQDSVGVVSSHSQRITANADAPTPVPKSETKTKWTQSGNPIDTTEFDSKIVEARKNLKTKPDSEDAKKALASAFVERGIALTDARQYASALGDYRKALKLEPANAEAKKWIDQIVGIYQSINREYPPEGEEPPPQPFKKEI